MQVFTVDCDNMRNISDFEDLLYQVEGHDQNADVSICENSALLQLVKPSEVDPCLYSFDSKQERESDISCEITESHKDTVVTDESENNQQQQVHPTTAAQTQEGNTLIDNIASTGIFTTMLSPPSSSEGSDIGDINDVESLFPELVDIENQIVRAAELAEHAETQSKNIIRVSISHKPASGNVMMTSNSSNVKTVNTYSANMHDYAVTSPSSVSSKYVSKLGRPPKYVELEPECGYADCGPMSKNAILARENRRRKKEYLTSLESELSTLKSDNEDLTTKLSSANETIDNLNDEIEYLKSVIANETTLGALLQNIPTATGVSLKRGRQTKPTSQPAPEKRRKVDHDYLSLTTAANNSSRPGVCLHVADGSVSLEFCSKCNVRSQQHQQRT